MSRSWRELLRDGADRLERQGIEGAMRDARAIAAHALDIEPGRLTLAMDDPVSQTAFLRYMNGIEQRGLRVPISHIRRWREFYGRRFAVTRAVLDPRPETEILVAAALERRFERVLDLGTGSGCILLTLLAERPDSSGIGTDVSAAALEIARENAAALGLAASTDWHLGKWFAGLDGRFDLIVSNPPYIAAHEMARLDAELDHEPRGALTDGGDGLGAYRAIAAGVRDHLPPGGRLLLEIGPTQAEAVAEILALAELDEITVLPDLDGRDRVLSAENRPKTAF